MSEDKDNKEDNDNKRQEDGEFNITKRVTKTLEKKQNDKLEEI